jgi:hypothetical protein
MTEPRPDRRRAPARRRFPAWPVAGASLALFLAVFVFLAQQMRAGRDPALARAAAATPAKRVVVRRVERRVIERVYDDDDGEEAGGDDGYSNSTSSSGSAAAVTSAPAPVTTRSS